MAYNWRRMSEDDRRDLLALRQRSGQPWHGPPHGLERHWYHISASCYEHRPVLGKGPERMAEFEDLLLASLSADCERVCVWCLLPNHYHILVQCRSLPFCRKAIGKLHGVLSRRWNLEEGCPGRKCWHRCIVRPVKNEKHRWATVNYIHHNPVRHGYATRWQDWPFSSAVRYLEDIGRSEAERLWREYPILNMGHNWDPPEC